jgi:hypothetical protein
VEDTKKRRKQGKAYSFMAESKKKKVNYEDLLKGWQLDPFDFIYDMWGLVPQPLKPEHEDKRWSADASIFEPAWFEEFEKGKHLTWQQFLLIRAIKRAINKEDKLRISVESGHGTGKSATLAMLMIWFLMCFENAQIPCTAPTQHQLHDVLWKEVKVWMDRMPEKWRDTLEWQAGYIRIKGYPETWFARARTARKEAPEALAGVHGEHVLFLIDEASGVPEEVFDTAEGALTGENVIVVMISNHTRVLGYFHNSHTGDRKSWQTLTFNSEDSPIVEGSFVQRILDKSDGDKNSDEYRIRVLGVAPRAELADEQGYVPLIIVDKVTFGIDPEYKFVGSVKLGVDPSGEGKDYTSWVVRDNFKGKVVAREKTSTGKTIALKTITLMDYYEVDDENVYVDSFGEGVDTIRELALAGKAVNAINVGHQPIDQKAFLNIRAESYWAVRQWLYSGAELLEGKWKEQLPAIKYRRELSGKMSIMPKKSMRKQGIDSPDDLDALMLTFTQGADVEEWSDADGKTTIEEEQVVV